MRKYELMFIVDPRLTDEEVVALSDEYKTMLEASGGEVFKEESWGKRKLAYTIENLNEGNYTLFYVRCESGQPFKEVEQRLSQNEKILRYITVRTDAGRLRHRGEAEVEIESPSEAPKPEPVAEAVEEKS